MTDKRIPVLDAKKASALLRWYFGEHTGTTLGFSVALLIFGGLFVNGLFQIILDGIIFWQGVRRSRPFRSWDSISSGRRAKTYPRCTSG